MLAPIIFSVILGIAVLLTFLREFVFSPRAKFKRVFGFRPINYHLAIEALKLVLDEKAREISQLTREKELVLQQIRTFRADRERDERLEKTHSLAASLQELQKIERRLESINRRLSKAERQALKLVKLVKKCGYESVVVQSSLANYLPEKRNN